MTNRSMELEIHGKGQEILCYALNFVSDVSLQFAVTWNDIYVAVVWISIATISHTSFDIQHGIQMLSIVETFHTLFILHTCSNGIKNHYVMDKLVYV